ncbi:hypothetical protein L3Q82_010794 [Scortum barcoo]|uniref:Uncharacterized protein n=1 Tax=Scortum barcoo TaxID=214431 RepID=A0ACB8W923_9TELE|nr:hypothetical protein L3Q82_010794 [Scortum barcoo]
MNFRSRMAFQRDIKNCNVLVFTETWLDPSIPDSAIVPEGLSIHRQDRTIHSGKSKGGGVCFMVNNKWCSDVEDYFYGLFSGPGAPHDQMPALLSSTTETSRPEAAFAFIVAGDFNSTNLRKVLPRYHQHISCPTRGENTLDHVYTPYADTYKALPRSPFGKSDHASVLLLPSYRQKLKRDGPVTRTIQQWSDQSDSALRDCFSTTEWCKPWVNGEVRAKLKARTDAYNSGDLEEYRKSRYALRRAISSAKRQYRDKVESHYKGSNTRSMWAGLKTLTDYKKKISSAEGDVSASLPDELNTFYARFESTSPAIMKCFEQSTEDAIALTLHTALSHLDQRDTYVRMLFIDYSSAFNTIVPSKLITKLRDLGLNSALCDWILNFLTSRP